MKYRYPLLFLASFALYSGCSSPKKTDTPASSTDSVTTEETGSAPEPDDETLFTRYDRVKQAVQEWNTAIDGHKHQALNNLYADRVECYLETKSQQACVDGKARWLQAHPGYRQQVEHLQVYYFEDDTLLKVFVAEFDKVCQEGDKTSTVPSFLYFSNNGAGWQIFKETDVPTEVQRARKAPAQVLPKGELTFRRSYQADTRDIPGFAHENVPYDFSLYLNVGETITGNYLLYSGTMRSTTNYLIPEGKITDGVLEMTVIYYGEEEANLEDYDPNETNPDRVEHWHLKIVNNGTELVCMDADNGYLYGKSLWLAKN